MLPTKQRLNLRSSFKWVRAGQQLGNEYLRVYYRFGDQPTPLAGVAISSSISPLATKRNRARRLASSGLEVLYPELRPNLNLVVMPTGKVLQLSSSQLTEILKGLLKVANLLK